MSLDAQRAKIEAYAQLYDLDIVAVVEDAGVSAKSLNRPGLQQCLAMLKSGEADALLTTKLDRITRSVSDLGALLDDFFAGGRWALMSISENIDTRSAAGRLVLNVLVSVAQWEREACSERTAIALHHKANNGEFTGGLAPYGYRLAEDGVHLVEEPAEQLIIEKARAMKESGFSVRGIVKHFTGDGHCSRVGKPFGRTQIARMLRDECEEKDAA